MFDSLKYEYVEIKECNLQDLYKQAEQLETLGYQVVSNGVFHNGYRYTLKMRKVKNITKKTYINIMGWCFVIVGFFIAFIFGMIIGAAGGADIAYKKCSKESYKEKRI